MYTSNEMKIRSQEFFDWINTRKIFRDFSDKPVPENVNEDNILSTSTEPSGAHKQS